MDPEDGEFRGVFAVFIIHHPDPSIALERYGPGLTQSYSDAMKVGGKPAP